ncbi:hypothetical protein [Streptomyces turgidiscabies]|uniref:Uncharacterized protein n=1 Tax=Streptomyces turgidiscabies TaxID=85558 RepID=A0ABU0RP48_9ACTN|nr:hypothetical protein [Streptomyces turgidiscabies]MDQ0933771.1 hypothetical protein [Streptomyces turgidiscabies]
MTTSAVRARDTPGRTAAPQQIDALLVVDTENVRARYECYRPGCPRPREVPVQPSAIRAFIGGIKARHLGQYHGEQR